MLDTSYERIIIIYISILPHISSGYFFAYKAIKK